MKKNIYLYLFLLAGWLTVLSCSDDVQSFKQPEPEKEQLPIVVRLSTKTAAAPDINCSLWIFSRKRNSEENYLLDQWIKPIETSSLLKFTSSQLQEKEFRFLFVATPAAAPEIKTTLSDGITSPSVGASWQDLRLCSQTPALSLDNYYGITDMSGEEISATDSIRGNLSRMVGQLVFDFFKIGNSLQEVLPIDTAIYSSVFDRIYEIEISYSGLTDQLSIQENGLLQAAHTTDTESKQTITPLPSERLKIELPQTPLDTLSGGITAGGRVLGYCCLPSAENVRINMIFRYYDTTPTCGEPGEIHKITCFDQKELRLNLPADQTSPGLPVKANAYTVNKAGIRCDRIIDIRFESDFTLLLDWN